MGNLFMKLSDMFDQNPMYSSDETVAKHISVNETPSKVVFEPKGQGHSNKTENYNRTKIFHPLINRAGIRLVTVQLMSQTGL